MPRLTAMRRQEYPPDLLTWRIMPMRALINSPRRAEGRGPGPFICAAAMAVGLISGTLAQADDGPARVIDFNREIRPILSNACFQCHGPDANKRKGSDKPLRLDTEDGPFAPLGGEPAVVRGKPDESELIARIVSNDPTEIMPPAETGKTLSPKDVELLTEWVRQGAKYAKHWSYVKPERPALPEVKRSNWPRNAIDRFVLARLEKEGLEPSSEAENSALIRRLTLDLTGLPPSLAEVDRFVKDESPDAYDRL
ncbi:DUF1549 domain-containing protein, partial [Singulisphaera rosea]